MRRGKRRRKARKLMKNKMAEMDKINTTRQERRKKAWKKAIEEVRNEDKDYHG